MGYILQATGKLLVSFDIVGAKAAFVTPCPTPHVPQQDIGKPRLASISSRAHDTFGDFLHLSTWRYVPEMKSFGAKRFPDEGLHLSCGILLTIDCVLLVHEFRLFFFANGR